MYKTGEKFILFIMAIGLGLTISILPLIGLSDAFAIPLPLLNPGFENTPDHLEHWTATDNLSYASATPILLGDGTAVNLIFPLLDDPYTASLSQEVIMPTTSEEVIWSFWFDDQWLTSLGSKLGFCAEIIGVSTTISLKLWSHHHTPGEQFFVFDTHESLDVQDVDFLHSYLVTSSDLKPYFTAGENLTVTYTEYGIPGLWVPDVILDAHPPVPEPTTFLLFLTGLACFTCIRFRRKPKA